MFIFHWKRCVVGRELVGTKTCGSTLSSACSRSFIAYFAKSAAVAYGEVDCSSPLAAPTIAKVKQTDKSLFIRELPPPFYLMTCISARHFPCQKHVGTDS